MRYPFLLATAFPLAAALAGCRDHPGTATPSRLPGVCAEIAAVPLESLNRVLLPATYAFQLRRPASIDIEMVSGGGGGGGSSDHNLGWAKPGEGGGAGGYLFKTFRLNAGFYFVKVGGSGARGMSVPPAVTRPRAAMAARVFWAIVAPESRLPHCRAARVARPMHMTAADKTLAAMGRAWSIRLPAS